MALEFLDVFLGGGRPSRLLVKVCSAIYPATAGGTRWSIGSPSGHAVAHIGGAVRHGGQAEDAHHPWPGQATGSLMYIASTETYANCAGRQRSTWRDFHCPSTPRERLRLIGADLRRNSLSGSLARKSAGSKVDGRWGLPRRSSWSSTTTW